MPEMSLFCTSISKIEQYNSKTVPNHRIVYFIHQVVTFTQYSNEWNTITNRYVTIKG